MRRTFRFEFQRSVTQRTTIICRAETEDEAYAHAELLAQSGVAWTNQPFSESTPYVIQSTELRASKRSDD